jgi:hypothetical protein
VEISDELPFSRISISATAGSLRCTATTLPETDERSSFRFASRDCLGDDGVLRDSRTDRRKTVDRRAPLFGPLAVVRALTTTIGRLTVF